jgi:hypothetical protein
LLSCPHLSVIAYLTSGCQQACECADAFMLSIGQEYS